MDFEEFLNSFLKDITNDNYDCLNQIDHFKELIEKNFGEKGDEENIVTFINNLTEIIVQKQNDFKLIESILNKELFSRVLSKFKESHVLIEVCKNGNEEAAKWLLTLDINTCTQDEKGMTALMYAVKHDELLSFVETLLDRRDDSINMEDGNGETALFHCIYNMEILNKVANSPVVDINHLNKNEDNVLLYCCKQDILEPIKILAYSKIDVNKIDSEGKMASMYLVDHGRYHEIELIAGSKTDFDYRTKNDETVLSILIKNIYKLNGTDDPNAIIPYIKIFMILVQMDCNFNISIDEEGNTPLMFFIMIKDFCSVGYLMTFSRSLNVSMKNKLGETAFSYSLKIEPSSKINKINKDLIERIMRHKSFNFEYYDKHHNNLLMNYIANNNHDMIQEILNHYPKFVDEVNYKNENAIIIATKLYNVSALRMLLPLGPNLDQQDNMGNTALHYAVNCNNSYSVKDLVNAGANINIKNNEGKTPLDLAINNNNKSIIELLNQSNPVIENENEMKKRNNKKKGGFLSMIKKSMKKNDKNNLDVGVYHLTYSERRNIISFELTDNKPKYTPLEPYKEIFEVVKSVYLKTCECDYSDMKSGLNQIGPNTFEVSEKNYRPSHLIQEECSKYIKKGDYEKAIEVYRKALRNEEDPPFCHVWSIIEDTLKKMGAITKVKVDVSDNLTSKSRKMLYDLSDHQLTKAFSLIHEFIKIQPKFSINDLNKYLDSQIELESNERKLTQKSKINLKNCERDYSDMRSDLNQIGSSTFEVSEKNYPPSHLIQEECSKYIKKGDYEKAIEVYRKALRNEEDPPFCHVWSIIEDTLKKMGVITKVKVDVSDNLTSKSRKMLYDLSDHQLTKAFSLIHEFVKIQPKFSMNDLNKYLDSQIELESNKRKLTQKRKIKRKRAKIPTNDSV
jgi:ankyrin repeat protein